MSTITKAANSSDGVKLFSSKSLARTAMLAAVFIWGSTFVITKIALVDLGPIMLAILRFAIATAIFLPFLVSYKKQNPLPWLSLVIVGFFGVTLFFALQNLGLYYTSAVNAGLILGSIPVFTLLFSALFLGEKLSSTRIVGVICSVSGVSLIVLTGSPAGAGSFPILGNMLLLGSAVAWALYTVKGKSLLRSLPQHVVTAGSVSFGLLFLLLFLPLEARFVSYQPLSAATWLAVGYLGFFASGAAFFLWNHGLKSVSAAEAGTYTNLSPVVAVVTAAILLGEPIGLSHLVGGSMVIIGVYFAGR